MPKALQHRLQIEYVSPDKLIPFAGNPRKLSDKGLAKLRRSLSEFGFVNPILAQRGTNMVVAGHQRLKAALANGETEVPVIFLDFDDVTARAYNLADNRLAEESDWDFAALADMLTELDTGAIDIELTGFDMAELEKMVNWAKPIELEDVKPQPATPTHKCPKCGFEF